MTLALPAALGIVAIMLPEQQSPVQAIVSFAAGLFVYTLVEYLVHRGMHVFGSAGHADHHRRARDLIGLPPFFGALSLASLWVLLSIAIGTAPALAFVIGSSLGYSIYVVRHTLVHHAPGFTRQVMPWVFAYHQAHHRNGRVNFGVTTSLFDRLFGTYRKGEA